MGKIDTFIIGAQKAGTTSLYNWLGQHHLIEAPIETKDQHFFCEDNNLKGAIKKLENCYSSKNATRKIHAAVNYMYFHSDTSKKIFNYNPDARIIVCLRDPIKRALSAYKYMTRTLRENNSFRYALKREMNDEIHSFEDLANNTYISHGYYLDQINSYLEYFNHNQIHFVLFEELIDVYKQQSVMQDVENFLQIDNGINYSFTHFNSSGVPKNQVINFLKRKSGITRLFKPLLPYKVRKRIGKFVEERNISNNKIQVDYSKEDMLFLEEIFKEKNQGLNQFLINRYSPDWLENIN